MYINIYIYVYVFGIDYSLMSIPYYICIYIYIWIVFFVQHPCSSCQCSTQFNAAHGLISNVRNTVDRYVLST